MKCIIELKHVGPRAHVQHLIEELVARLEEKLAHFPSESISLHVAFEENGSHKLYHMSISCHLPKRTVAAKQEGRDAGLCIRKAFAEVQRQLEKQKATIRHEHDLRRSRRIGKGGWVKGRGLGTSAESKEVELAEES